MPIYLGAENTPPKKTSMHIAVEIKGFSSPSPVTELERAVGQYYLYLTFISKQEPERDIYLAIPEKIYYDFFNRPSIQLFLQERKINYLVLGASQICMHHDFPT